MRYFTTTTVNFSALRNSLLASKLQVGYTCESFFLKRLNSTIQRKVKKVEHWRLSKPSLARHAEKTIPNRGDQTRQMFPYA